MKLLFMPKEFSWWIWLATAGALLAGLVIAPTFLLVAVAISVIQSVIFLRLHRSLTPYPVQIRLAYTALLLLCLLPGLRWLYWLPTIGTFALVCFGYCLLARILSLAPWNRHAPLSRQLVQRTFLAAPVVGRADHGLSSINCNRGSCDLEARIAFLSAHKTDSNF
jgi:hypothetical protein